MIIVKYDPQCTAPQSCVPDGEIETFIARLREQARASLRDVHATVNSETVIVAIRCSIAVEELDFREVRFQFGELLLQPDKYGQILGGFPKGFCDLTETYLDTMVKAQSAKRLATGVQE